MILTNKREAILDLVYFIVSTNEPITAQDLKNDFEREFAYFKIDKANLDNILGQLVKDGLILLSGDKYSLCQIPEDELAGGYLTKKYVAKNKTRVEQFKDKSLKIIPIFLTCVTVTLGILTYISAVEIKELTEVKKDLNDSLINKNLIISTLKEKLSTLDSLK